MSYSVQQFVLFHLSLVFSIILYCNGLVGVHFYICNLQIYLIQHLPSMFNLCYFAGIIEEAFNVLSQEIDVKLIVSYIF